MSKIPESSSDLNCRFWGGKQASNLGSFRTVSPHLAADPPRKLSFSDAVLQIPS